MKQDSKLIMLYANAGSAQNQTAEIAGFDQLRVNVKQIIGTNQEDKTADIKIEVRDFTHTDDGDTAYTTIVGTAATDPVTMDAYTLASSSAAVTEKTLDLSRSVLRSAKLLRINVSHAGTQGADRQTVVSIAGLIPKAGIAADVAG
jgi:hypothetical protein